MLPPADERQCPLFNNSRTDATYVHKSSTLPHARKSVQNIGKHQQQVSAYWISWRKVAALQKAEVWWRRRGRRIRKERRLSLKAQRKIRVGECVEWKDNTKTYPNETWWEDVNVFHPIGGTV